MNIESIHYVLRAIEDTFLYSLAIFFYGFYPIATSFIYVVTAVLYNHRRSPSAPASHSRAR